MSRSDRASSTAMETGTGHDPLTTGIDAWLRSCRAESTRSAYRGDLASFVEWCRRANADPLDFSPEELERYRDDLYAAGSSPATVARRLSAIASFGNHVREGGSAPFPDVVRPVAARSSSAVVLDDDQARALLDAADRLDVRSSVLMRLLMLDGLKVSEAAAADADALSGARAMTLQLETRAVRLHQGTVAAIRSYLGPRRSGPLLLSNKRGRTTDRLTRFGINYLVKEAAEAASLPSTVSGNVLRRRYVVAAHTRGTDIEEIRRNAGH